MKNNFNLKRDLRFIISAVMAAAAMSIAAADEALQAEINQARTRLRTAVEKNDRAAVEPLLTQQFFYVHGSGVVNNREERVVALMTGRAMETQPEEQFLVQRIDDKSSMAWGRTKMPARGTSEAFLLNWNTLYIKEDGGWRLAYIQSWR